MDKSQIEERINVITEALAIGKRVLQECKETSPPGLIGQIAEESGISRDKCQKLRQLVAPETGYSTEELCGWYESFRNSGFALSITHFVKLVSVSDRRVRNRLTRQAIKQRWSTHRLQREILDAGGRRMLGGRRPTIVTGDGFDAELETQLYSWRRWIEFHLDANDEMEADIRTKLTTLKKQLDKLHRSVSTK